MSSKADVFIVDDETALGAVYVNLISNDMVKAHYFSSAAEALKAIEDGLEPVVVVTDLKMPDLSGLDLMNQLRAKGIQSTLIMISAYAEKYDVINAIGYGIFGFLEKPFSPQLLREAINSALKDHLIAQIDRKLLSLSNDMIAAYEGLVKQYVARYTQAETKLFERHIMLRPKPQDILKMQQNHLAQSQLAKTVENSQMSIRNLIQLKEGIAYLAANPAKEPKSA